MKEGARIAHQAFDPTTEIGKANATSRIRTNEEFEHWSKGDTFLKVGQFDSAINEYKLINKYGRKEWESRTLLSKAYEIAGKYSEALQEIDWIISQKPRKDVLDGYIRRRNEIKSQISGKKFDFHPGETLVIQAGVTTKDYVLKKLGKPDKVGKANGGEVWSYNNFPVNFASRDELDTKVIEFDNRGLVKEDYLEQRKT